MEDDTETIEIVIIKCTYKKQRTMSTEKEKNSKTSKEDQNSKSESYFDSEIDWEKIPYGIEHEKYRRNKSTVECTHTWMSKWRKDAFVPPFSGYTDFLTLGSFVEAANKEVIGALKVWIDKHLELLDNIEYGVGGKEISRMAFEDQRSFVDYIETKVITWLKTITNMPIRVLNEDMLLVLLSDHPTDERKKSSLWLTQTVHLVKNIARSRVFKLKFVPFLDKRNFEITTVWPEYEDQAQSYGKLEVWDYTNEADFDISND